ncbi:MAG: P-loop NTPase [Chloroflexota bacterium]
MIGSSNAVQEPRPEQVAEPHGVVIALFGAKGGVGASTVAVNLALCAQQQRTKESVALVDLNLQAGDLHLLLGLEPAHRWRGVMRQADRLDATFLMSLLATLELRRAWGLGVRLWTTITLRCRELLEVASI